MNVGSGQPYSWFWCMACLGVRWICG